MDYKSMLKVSFLMADPCNIIFEMADELVHAQFDHGRKFQVIWHKGEIGSEIIVEAIAFLKRQRGEPV